MSDTDIEIQDLQDKVKFHASCIDKMNDYTEATDDRLESLIKRVAKLESQVDRLIALLGEVVKMLTMLQERK